MKKLFLLALGCGLALITMACSEESKEELIERTCDHMIKCEVKGYSADSCNVVNLIADISASDDPENNEPSKCESELRTFLSCKADAKCDDLKAGTDCKKEMKKLTACTIKSVLGK